MREYVHIHKALEEDKASDSKYDIMWGLYLIERSTNN